MTGGGAFIPTGAEDFELDEYGQAGGSSSSNHDVQWVGKPGVKGPKWARLPLLTVGMLGIQCVWSIEMGYASPYLLDLGLSKSWMSLVFMAGPLSGLVVQPLVGAFADKSKSRFGRRRPYMLAGCTICVFAMMLLGWTREIASFFGFGNWMAVFLAVWAIYLIDFSINAAMSTDRALVVDTLPPREQEEGSAWAGRMFGFGGLAGFFVGNLDLEPVLPFLGRTQLQILSFITSAILMTSHFFTAWGVNERVLLRDDRPQKTGLWHNIKSIWDNMMSLPPGIKTVCIIQFFASLGWYPVLFFTTMWVTEVYKQAHPELDPTDPDVGAAAVRAGARSLLCQSLVNIVCSVLLPFVVGESGVVPGENQGYTSLNGHGNGIGNGEEPIGSATWKMNQQELARSNALKRFAVWVKDHVSRYRAGEKVLPLNGLTLMKMWLAGQIAFALAMFATWFVTTPEGAYFVIGSTGFAWAMYQWAPFCLLGELILLEGSIDRTGTVALNDRLSMEYHNTQTHEDEDNEYTQHHNDSSHDLPLYSRPESRVSIPLENEDHPSSNSKTKSNSHSRSNSKSKKSRKSNVSRKSRPDSLDLERTESGTLRGGDGLTPLVAQQNQLSNPDLNIIGGGENENSIILHHSDSESEDDEATSAGSPFRPLSPRSPVNGSGGGGGKDIGDKAGIILGIHNLFLVFPQFIVTFLSSVIFYVMEPAKELPGHHPNANPIPGAGVNATDIAEAVGGIETGIGRRLGRREGIGTDVSSPDAVGLIFLIGGVSAATGSFICWKLGRSFARGQGI